MRGSVRAVGILDVLPLPAVVDDLLERRLEVAGDERVGALVDRHACRRVGDVDERRGGAVRAVERLPHQLGDVDQLGLLVRADSDLLHAGILRTRSMAAVPTPRELDDYREQADRFIATIDEEYYLHFAGHKDELELEPIYDRFSELTSLEMANRVGSAVDGDRRTRELWKFACSGHLGALTREQEEKAARVEAELTATVDGEEIPFRMLRPTMANEPDRDKRQAARARPQRAHGGTPPAAPARGGTGADRGRARARRDQLPRAARALRLPARRDGRALPRVPRRNRAHVGGRRRQALPRAGRRFARGGAALRRRRASSARRSGTRRSRPTR